MKIDKKTPYGGIDISLDAIACVAQTAAKSCYGVVGLSRRNSVLDAAKEILSAEKIEEGIYVRKIGKEYEIDIYLCCAEGVKLPEILSQTQKRVAYDLEKAFGIGFKGINVYVTSVQEA